MPGRLLITAFGWNDPGGGTTVPRLTAKELARRGWEVTVFHAAVQPTPSRQPYELVEWTEDDVRLIGVHNRQHLLFDIGHPLRELDDPPITAAFAAALDRLRPDVVHFHNLHNLGASLLAHPAARGLPAYFTTHNYWLFCPRAYLLTGGLEICPGPGDGSRCAPCVGSADVRGHERRLSEIRALAHSGLTKILAVSDAVRAGLLGVGYDPGLVDVVRQAMPHEREIWEQVGRDRLPGRRRERLTVAFLGSAYPHKGPQLLVEAAQRAQATLDVRILGEVTQQFADRLRQLDQRGVVSFHGSFAPAEIGGLLADVDLVALPSMWWDCAPLAAAECLAARTPLVVPRLGGLPEAIQDGVNGLLFTPLDSVDLAHQLDRVAREPGLLERLQQGIEAPRAFSAYVDELEAIYAGDGGDRPLPAAQAPGLRWLGDHSVASSSLSIINDRVTERLGANLQRVRRDGTPIDPPLACPAAVEVRQSWPPQLEPAPSGKLAAIVPWEFGSVPADWVAQITENVDELWVPSEYVRAMFVTDGVPSARVQVIPNGVDLTVFSPSRERAPDVAVTRFLFVGGLIWRKGSDILLDAFTTAFAGRDDVELVIKDVGGDSFYRMGDRDRFREHAASGALPRITLHSDELSTADLVDLYRSCDVLLHPYRGEGFAMPVLEAMACGLPVIVTAGGPTDEFCPPQAGWRIPAVRREFPAEQLRPFITVRPPSVLEPDRASLVAMLREVQADPHARRERGRAAQAAAERLSWDAIAAMYGERLQALLSSPPRMAQPASTRFPLAEDVVLRLLATPAWSSSDALDLLLRDWARATTPSTSGCLYLLADPAVSGTPEAAESRVLQAAERGGIDLEGCADINILFEPFQAERDRWLHAAVDGYVPLHAGCAGHVRLAHAAGNWVHDAGSSELAALLSAGAG